MPTRLPPAAPNESRLRPPGSMELDPAGGPLATEETPRLIASNKVEGTPVFSRAGDQLGVVHNFMVDKYSGQVAYVVMLCGGFLGLGGSHHPLPWRALKYDPRLGGYVVNADDSALISAPRYSAAEDPFMDPAYPAQVEAHYFGVRAEAGCAE
jgi:hypothetical protein